MSSKVVELLESLGISKDMLNEALAKMESEAKPKRRKARPRWQSADTETALATSDKPRTSRSGVVYGKAATPCCRLRPRSRR